MAHNYEPSRSGLCLVCNQKAVDLIHVPVSNVPLPLAQVNPHEAEDMVPRPTDHKVFFVKRVKWLPAWKWNLKLDMIDRNEGEM